jgi:hypothetical protein
VTLSLGFTASMVSTQSTVHIADGRPLRTVRSAHPARGDSGESREIIVKSPDLCGLMDELDDLFENSSDL